MTTLWPLLLFYVLPLAGLWAFRRGSLFSLTLAAICWGGSALALGVLISAPGGFSTIAFYLLSLFAVMAAFLVVTGSNPVYSALSLVGAFLGIAGVFVVLQSEFFAVVQVILYAGAILILYLFVVMMVDLPKETAAPRSRTKGVLATVLGLALLALLVRALAPLGTRLVSTAPLAPAGGDPPYSVRAIGAAIFGPYLVPFEVASLILLAALVGAIVLSIREREDRP